MKNSLRNLLFLLLIPALFLSCRKQKNFQAEAEQKTGLTKITATFYPLYIILMNITENAPEVELSLIAPANTGCLHDYQLTTKDMQAIENCSILVANGAGMEDFLEKALKIKKDSTIVASQDFPLVDDNPHVWVSPQGELWQIKTITEGLCRLNPENAGLYRENALKYSQKVQALEEEMHQELKDLQGRKTITFHEAFPYFSQEFKLDTVAIIEREPGTEPTARELSDLIDVIKESGKDTMLFAEPQYSNSAAQVIAQETGLKVQELDPAVTGPLEKDAWLNAMRKNLEVLKSNL